MHYFLICIVPEKATAKATLDRLMAPYSEELPGCGDDPDAPWNADGTWDWYRVGGRYDGYVRGEIAESTDNGFNFDDRHETVDNNLTLVTELLERWPDSCSYAILTPDGKWVSRDSPDDFRGKPEDDWREEARAVLADYPDHYALGVDCHT